jgi:hypothetical protein
LITSEEVTIIYNTTWPEWWQIGLWIVASVAYWDLVKYLGKRLKDAYPGKVRTQRPTRTQRGSHHRASPSRNLPTRVLAMLDLRRRTRHGSKREASHPHVPPE